jgi:hypothetical protein
MADSLSELLTTCALYCAEHELDEPPENPSIKDLGVWVGKMVFHAEKHPDAKGSGLVLDANKAAGKEFLNEEG